MGYGRVNYKTAREKKILKYYKEKKLYTYATVTTEEEKEFFRYYRELVKDLYK